MWPTNSQELLLRAAALRGPAALAAWQAWKAQHDLVASPLDQGSLRLLPLLYKNLVAHAIDEPVMGRLRGTYRRAWYANHHVFREAVRVLDTLAEMGVPTIVLRGAAVATLYYRDVGARPMFDLDLLVPRAQAASAIRGLTERGWSASTMGLAEELRFGHSLRLRGGSGQEVAVHWLVFAECRHEGADDAFWNRVVPLRLLEARTCALDPTDSLLHTVVDGTRWRPEPAIRWIPDTMAILRAAADAIDWDRLSEDAAKRGLRLRLGRGLSYVRETLDAPVPARVLQQLSSGPRSYVERAEYRWIMAGPTDTTRSAFGSLPSILVGYLRFAAGMSLFRKLTSVADYLRHAYALPGRSHLLWLVLRQTAHRAGRLLAS